MSPFVFDQANFAGRLLQAKVDEIEIKIRCKNEAGELTSVRLMASSMGGKWLEVRAHGVEIGDRMRLRCVFWHLHYVNACV